MTVPAITIPDDSATFETQGQGVVDGAGGSTTVDVNAGVCLSNTDDPILVANLTDPSTPYVFQLRAGLVGVSATSEAQIILYRGTGVWLDGPDAGSAGVPFVANVVMSSPGELLVAFFGPISGLLAPTSSAVCSLDSTPTGSGSTTVSGDGSTAAGSSSSCSDASSSDAVSSTVTTSDSSSGGASPDASSSPAGSQSTVTTTPDPSTSGTPPPTQTTTQDGSPGATQRSVTGYASTNTAGNSAQAPGATTQNNTGAAGDAQGAAQSASGDTSGSSAGDQSTSTSLALGGGNG